MATSPEANWSRHAAFCPERRWQPLPITEVQRQREGLMLELFGVSKCHGVERDGKGQRGFRGVKFKAAEATDLFSSPPD